MQLLSTKKNKLLLLLPTCLVYVVYIILPILVSLYYSFTKYSGISKPRLYGLKNYIRLLDDPYFWIALKTQRLSSASPSFCLASARSLWRCS